MKEWRREREKRVQKWRLYYIQFNSFGFISTHSQFGFSSFSIRHFCVERFFRLRSIFTGISCVRVCVRRNIFTHLVFVSHHSRRTTANEIHLKIEIKLNRQADKHQWVLFTMRSHTRCVWVWLPKYVVLRTYDVWNREKRKFFFWRI